MTKKEFKSKLVKLEDEGRFFSPLGEEVCWELVQTNGIHRLLLGGTGWGKTFVTRTAMKILGNEFVAVNAHPGMDIRDLVGQWRPQPLASGGVTIEWEDGTFTNAIREGKTFMLEEATRAPQEFMSRMYGVMDSEGAYWSLPENGEADVSIEDGFSVIATANPPGKGYMSQNLDKAFLRRFKWVRSVNEPLADEEKKLGFVIGDSTTAQKDRVKRFMNWLEDARESSDTNINTGDIVAVAELTLSGFTPMKAIEYAITPKYGNEAGLLTAAKAHFSDAESNKVIDPTETVSPASPDKGIMTDKGHLNTAEAETDKDAHTLGERIANMSTEEILKALSKGIN